MERGVNAYTRIGMYIFIIGAILSVLDSAFPVEPSMRGLVYVALIFTGIFAGILNITPDEEHHFLLSSGAFLIVILAFNQLFAAEQIVVVFSHFFQNAVAFVGSMALAVALKTILEYGSDNIIRGDALESMRARTERIEDWQLSKGMRAWHAVVFIAVAVTFIMLLLDLFFAIPDSFALVIEILDWIIVAVFVADLFVLFRQEGSWGCFFRNCWLDILAAIPFHGVFGVLKIVRLSRIAKLSLSLKFFSTSSGSNTYIRRKEYPRERLVVQEHPVTPQKESARAQEQPVVEELPVVPEDVKARERPAAKHHPAASRRSAKRR